MRALRTRVLAGPAVAFSNEQHRRRFAENRKHRDEKLAAKFPITDDPPFDYRWGNARKKDGTVVKP